LIDPVVMLPLRVGEYMHKARRIALPLLAALVLAGSISACSPYRARKKAPKKSSAVSFLDFRRAHCGCVGK